MLFLLDLVFLVMVTKSYVFRSRVTELYIFSSNRQALCFPMLLPRFMFGVAVSKYHVFA